MTALKGSALALLSIVLSVCLLAFGVAFTVNSTALNPHFVTAQTDRLDVGALAEEEFAPTTHATFSPELAAAVATAAGKLESQLKTQVNVAVAEAYDYLLGRTSSLDLAALAKRTVLSNSFVTAVVAQPAMTALVEQYIKDELTASVSPQDRAVIDPYLEKALPALDPWIRQQVDTVSGQTVDYLVGQQSTLNVVIPLDTMKATLRANLHDAFMASPPALLAGADQSQLEATFNQYWDEYSAQIPATFAVDSESLGLDTSVSVSQGLADAENGLAEARRAIGYFRVGYVLLIIFTVLLMAGIVAIHRNVKGAALNLGVPFLACGVILFIGAVIDGHYARTAIDSASTDLPGAVRSWLPGVQTAALRPLDVFSLVLAGVGLALIVVAIVYRPRRAVA